MELILPYSFFNNFVRILKLVVDVLVQKTVQKQYNCSELWYTLESKCNSANIQCKGLNRVDVTFWFLFF